MHSSDIDSVCTYCGTGCDITAQVKDNKIVKMYAKDDGFVSQGNFVSKALKDMLLLNQKIE